MASRPKFPQTRRQKFKIKTCRDDRFDQVDGSIVERDTVDGFPAKAYFSTFDLLVILGSIGSFFVDLGTDIWVAYVYYFDKEYWYFGMTCAFIMVPSLTMMVFSLRWYVMDYQQKKRDDPRNDCPVPVHVWLLRAVCLFFQLGPVLRYSETLHNGLKSRKESSRQRYYYQMMLYEDADSNLLRLFECFMEAAPQLVLQLYIMASQGTETDTFRIVIQAGSCCVSLFSLAWSLTSFHRALRYTRNDKKNLSRGAMIVLFLWRICTIGTRVLAIALFASIFHWYAFIIVGVHWLAMTIWLVVQRTNFCSHRCEEVLFNAICGIVYIFCFLNLKDGPTRFKYLAFYILTYLENVGMIVSWYLFSLANQPEKWYHLPSLLIVTAGFFLGIMIMQVYYLACHPTKDIKICLPTDEVPVENAMQQRSHNSHSSENSETVPFSSAASTTYTSPGIDSNSAENTPQNGVPNRLFINSESGTADKQCRGTLV